MCFVCVSLSDLSLSIERGCISNKVAFIPSIKDRSEFSAIVLSSTMGSDHLPDKYFFELEAAKNYAMRGTINM